MASAAPPDRPTIEQERQGRAGVLNVVTYDPAGRRLIVTMASGETASFALQEPIEFFETIAGEPPRIGMFCSEPELATLSKMIRYVVDRVRMTSEGRANLEAILARSEAALTTLEPAGEPVDAEAPPAEAPLPEED